MFCLGNVCLVNNFNYFMVTHFVQNVEGKTTLTYDSPNNLEFNHKPLLVFSFPHLFLLSFLDSMVLMQVTF